jgi:hypothetical protein
MLVSEQKLRKIIRKEILRESYTPENLFDPIQFGYNSKESVAGDYLGGNRTTGIYVRIVGKKPEGYSPVRNNNENLNAMLKLVRDTERGKNISQNGINKLKIALRDGQIYFSSGNKLIHDAVAGKPDVADYADLIYDTVMDTTGSVLSLFPPALGASATINASQAIKKYIQEKYIDGTISALAAFPIPAGAAAIKPGLTILTKMKTLAKEGTKAIARNLGDIGALIKGLSDIIDTIKKHKKTFLTFVKEEIFPLAKQTLAGAAITKISEAIDSIINSVQELIVELK